jgi:hypothetical protein
VPSSMETRKRPRQPIPRRRENQNILPLPKWKMTARRVLSWHTLCTPSISRIYSVFSSFQKQK